MNLRTVTLKTLKQFTESMSTSNFKKYEDFSDECTSYCNKTIKKQITSESKKLVSAAVLSTAKKLKLDVVIDDSSDISLNTVSVHADDGGAAEPIFLLHPVFSNFEYVDGDIDEVKFAGFLMENIWGWDGKSITKHITSSGELKTLILSLFDNEKFKKEFEELVN